ncbi:M48 family metalloprotease [bacterium]|nr:M48 family metalloprotease [bacterium]
MFLQPFPHRKSWMLVLAFSLTFSGCESGQFRRLAGNVLVPVDTELRLGQQFSQEVVKQQKVLAHEPTQAWVQAIGARVSEPARRARPEITYHFTVLDEPNEVNAFAVPGGYIYVYSGLLLLASDEAEIAGVLAHETGHIVGRHSANQMATSMGLDFLTSLALGDNPGYLAQMVAGLGTGSALLKYSRDDEYESDAYAVQYTREAGYDPGGIIRFFGKLRDLSARGEGLEFFRSHPLTQNRMDRVHYLIQNSGPYPFGERYEARMAERLADLRAYYQSRPAR